MPNKFNPTPFKVSNIINSTKVESKMTPMHAQSIFIYIYIKIHTHSLVRSKFMYGLETIKLNKT